MSFVITGLSPEPFRPLWGLSAVELAEKGVRRFEVTAATQVPDRIELRDALPGENVLLLNYLHQPAKTPYRASHAIFVLEGPSERYKRVDEIPPSLLPRILSLRGFGADGMMIEADLIEGREAADAVRRLFANPAVAYIQAHYAKFGCYAARIERAA